MFFYEADDFKVNGQQTMCYKPGSHHNVHVAPLACAIDRYFSHRLAADGVQLHGTDVGMSLPEVSHC
jgi:hypothetical protein